MYALTLHQPWASLIALGEKRIETRSWSTRYRGTIAIHAAANLPPGADDFALDEPARTALGRHVQQLLPVGPGAAYRIELPLGCVVALATLADVVPAGEVDLQRYARHEADFGNYSPGRHAWILEDVRPLREPLPARGRQRLWNLDPDLAREALRRMR